MAVEGTAHPPPPPPPPISHSDHPPQLRLQPPPAATDDADDDLLLEFGYLELDFAKSIEACEKSRAAVETWIHGAPQVITHDHQDEYLPHPPPHGLQQHRNLFLVESDHDGTISVRCTPEVQQEAEWGSRDLMINFRRSTHEQRMEYLRAAANFSGNALILSRLRLDEEEEKAWLQALSVSHAAGPKSLLIYWCSFNAYDLLTALNSSKWCMKGGPLKLLYLQLEIITYKDVEPLAGLASLTTLGLRSIENVPGSFVARLAELHPSHSPLPASLQRLHIGFGIADFSSCWRSAATAFMDHWPKLKHLTLFSFDKMSEEDLITIMDQYLAAVQSGNSVKKKATDYHLGGSTLAAGARSENHSTSPAAYTTTQLRSLTLGTFKLFNELSGRAVAAVVDALSKSGLPFLELLGINVDEHPAIEAQLQRNRRLWDLRNLKRVPATSIRLFICGDPYAGKQPAIDNNITVPFIT
jgi:hypothetical protein